MDPVGSTTLRKFEEAPVRTFEDHPTVWVCGGGEKSIMDVHMLCNRSLDKRSLISD